MGIGISDKDDASLDAQTRSGGCATHIWELAKMFQVDW
jgi:hypothetical protein